MACGSSSEEKSSEFIPDIPVECTAAQVADCAATAKPIFAGLISNLTADCDDFLTGMNATQRQITFEASSTSITSRSGIYLTASMHNWVNNTGGAIDTLLPGDYFVCAFVDSNSNGILDTNEPVGEGVVTLGETDFVLDTWSAAFN